MQADAIFVILEIVNIGEFFTETSITGFCMDASRGWSCFDMVFCVDHECEIVIERLASTDLAKLRSAVAWFYCKVLLLQTTKLIIAH